VAKLPMPVTVVMSRRAADNRSQELVTWAESLCTAASTFPGHLGHKVQELPGADGATEVVIGLSFDTSDDLVRWEKSAERAAALAAGAKVTQGPPTPLSLEALERHAWGDTATAPPSMPRWRTAVIVWLGLFPPAVLMNLLLEPYTGGWPTVLRTLLLTVVLVPVVVLGTVPLLNRGLVLWHRRRASPQQDPGHPG
jgi:antibiotic biosynthesis monooxygenase (ABM) superfamily enzyme